MRHLVLLLHDGHLCAAEKKPHASARAVRVEGSDAPIRCTDESALKNALLDLQDMPHDVLVVIADRRGRALWRNLLCAQPPLDRLLDEWELRRLEALPATGQGRRAVNATVTLAERIFSEDLDAALAEARNALETRITQETENWQQERARLEAEIATLTAQRDALRTIDVERLASYLPALYEHVFTVVPPTDLALLCHTLTPPAVSSPWPEPAPETVRRLQAEFRALPEKAQREIVAWAQNLPQAPRLVPRAEMREWIDGLTQASKSRTR